MSYRGGFGGLSPHPNVKGMAQYFIFFYICSQNVSREFLGGAMTKSGDILISNKKVAPYDTTFCLLELFSIS